PRWPSPRQRTLRSLLDSNSALNRWARSFFWRYSRRWVRWFFRRHACGLVLGPSRCWRCWSRWGSWRSRTWATYTGTETRAELLDRHRLAAMSGLAGATIALLRQRYVQREIAAAGICRLHLARCTKGVHRGQTGK